MTLRKDILTSILSVIVLTLLLGVGFPLLVEGISQVAFSGAANGERVYDHGTLVGSKLIGQNFGDVVLKHGKPELQNGNPVTNPDPGFFQTRPSGTTPADNASASSFANYGPNSTLTEQAIAGNVTAYLSLNCATTLSPSGNCSRWYDPRVTSAAAVPVDAADTSASGVDPDISVANADIQAYRIAAVRHLSRAKVDALINENTTGRGLGFSGEPGVDVLELNLAVLRAS